MRVLITGGAGFLGSHLADKLISMRYEVVILDNLYTGKLENITHLLNQPGFRFLNMDVTTPIALEVDMIFNLACPASPVQYQKFPVQTIKTSLLGAINVLELARVSKIPVFQASTSEIYGDPSVSPQPESYWGNVNTVGPRSCYDEGKRAAETLFMDYKNQFGVEICIARIFNTYGPRLDFFDGRVISNMVRQALTSENISIYGDGSQTRSFCYVDDLIDAFILCMDNIQNLTGPVNLGNPSEYSMVELAEIILDITKSKSKIVFEELPRDDPKQRRPDIGYAKEVLGWAPRISLQDGLSRTVDDFRQRLRRS